MSDTDQNNIDNPDPVWNCEHVAKRIADEICSTPCEFSDEQIGRLKYAIKSPAYYNLINRLPLRRKALRDVCNVVLGKLRFLVHPDRACTSVVLADHGHGHVEGHLFRKSLDYDVIKDILVSEFDSNECSISPIAYRHNYYQLLLVVPDELALHIDVDDIINYACHTIPDVVASHSTKVGFDTYNYFVDYNCPNDMLECPDKVSMRLNVVSHSCFYEKFLKIRGEWNCHRMAYVFLDKTFMQSLGRFSFALMKEHAMRFSDDGYEFFGFISPVIFYFDM